jgi:hypothetical protein
MMDEREIERLRSLGLTDEAISQEAERRRREQLSASAPGDGGQREENQPGAERGQREQLSASVPADGGQREEEHQGEPVAGERGGGGSAYPVTFEVGYPEQQSRWKTLLRLFLAIPVLLFFFVLSGAFWARQWPDGRPTTYSVGAAGAVVLAIWITIVLRARIPHWLFDFEVALLRWEIRACSYFALLTDTYPPFEGDYPVQFEVQYPKRLTRWKVFIWKAITSIPHMIILLFLSIGALFVVIAAWFAILFTGRFPRSLHSYVAGVMRWGARVEAYFLSLTDEYPPFSLSADAGPPSGEMYMLSSIGGCLVAVVLAAASAAALVLSRETVRVDVRYDDLTAGRIVGSEATVDVWSLKITLAGAVDPADEEFPLLVPDQGRRLVAFRLEFSNESRFGQKVRESDFRLRDSGGKWHDPLLAFVGGRAPPVTVGKHTAAEAIVLFEIGVDARPDQLRYHPGFADGKRVIFEFE